MLSRNQIKSIQALRQKKNRKRTGLFVAEGEKIVSELLGSGSGIAVRELYAVQGWLEKYAGRFGESQPEKVVEVSEQELDRISMLSTPNRVLAVCTIPEQPEFHEPVKKKLMLALDDVQDPGNLGTIVRIADWFGLERIVCSPGCADLYNAKTVQATMGSIARVRLHYQELVPFLKRQELPVYAAVLKGTSIYEEELPDAGIILMGNESSGISEELLALALHRIAIPSFGAAESLNVAIATAVICSEFRRQASLRK